jgi:eukaryotic-like serine/threonine-protein kinase
VTAANPLKVCPQCGTEYPANARFCEIDGTALRSAAGGNDLVGSIVADRYHIMKKLGEGGMGQVYLAEHVKMGRKSALKVMHPSMKADVDAISRFNREAANASRIAHPNVAAVYDFGETPDGIIYLAMEFVDGPPLTSVIEQQGALAPKRAAEIVRQTAEALAVAHDMGIVHRDLKPDNIMVAKTRDGGDLVKVVDFGIAKAAGNEAQKVTKTGLVVGTPEYMSPEQLAGDKLDGRSDIYSLGLVAYNMLTGKLPFPSESAQESMIMRLTDKPKPLVEMKSDRSWPVDVQAVMDKVLERDASLRYQNATEFGMALYNAIDRMPETKAAEMGTAVMGAVPATRVASAAVSGERGAGSETAAMPAAPISAAPVAHATAPGDKKSKVPMMAGAGAVVVIGLAAAMFAMKGKPSAAAADTTAKTAITTPTPTPTAPAASVTPQGEKLSKSVDAAASLDQLVEQAKDSTKAARVLNQLSKLTLSTSEDKAKAGLVRYNAYLFGMSDQPKACAAIKDVEGVSKGTKLEDRISALIGACS